ncbi:reverse transcriptase domain-containing protein [Tanacetum coccineum]|uniref:Reverse transcriptase domain-containing protein n=1 Tax=Tanacetum coccineum TaxID=301880 RepID=A0ABQ5D1W6_9ASTR
MSAMANSIPVITTIRNTDGREKTPRETDTAPQASIQEFCEKHYDDILSIIMEKARQDKRKGLQSRLDFGDTPKRARRIRSDSPSSGDRNSPARSRSRIRSHLRGVEESYGETYSSQRTRHRDRSRNDGHHGGMKKKRVNESPSSHASVSSSSHGTHQRPRRRRESTDEEDLAVPWTCEDVDPFTPSIRNFRSSRKTRMPNNVKTYDGTGDPKDHLKVFQVAAQLPAESIDGYTDLKAAFLSYFMQQKKYVKDSVEIHNIKQKDEETIEEFMKRFKTETGRMKGAPKCMRISGFMHGVNNPELTKRLNERVPKTMEEMMTTTAAFIRGETVTASKKKVHAPWKSQDQSKRHASDQKLELQKPDFRNQPREGRGSNKFTPLTRTPKEIFTTEAAKFKPPAPMLKKQIEELVRAGKLSQFVKGIRQEKDQQRPGKKDFPTKDKAAAIYMIQSWQRVTRQKVTQSFDRIREIVFPPLTANEGTEGPLVIEAEIGGHTVHRMYVDGGSSMEVLFEHCFNRLRPEVQSQMAPATTSLTGFSGETIWPVGQIRLLVTIGDAEHSTEAWMNFMIVRSPSPYNGIIGRPGIKAIQAIPSTTHGMIKFPVKGGVVTIRSTIVSPMECATVTATPKNIEEKTKKCPENFQVAIHPDFPDQEISIGGTLSAKGRTELCALLKRNLDIFAWQPSDMTGVPRSIAEHKLNIRKGYSPVRQKKRGQAPERAKAIQAEVQKLVEARIMCEVYYHEWLSNPVMVKKHDGSWRMCVDFMDLNKACPHDCYPLPEIDWKIESVTTTLSNASWTHIKGTIKYKWQKKTRKRQPSIPPGEEELLRDIEETFRTLRKINMKLNPKKCTFGAVEGMFLGYVVGPEGIKPCPDKVDAVLQLPSPRTIKEVQSLNGKLAGLNRFLSKSAEKSLPLFKTLKNCTKKSDFCWTSDAEKAFRELKQHLSKLPTLVAPRPQEELIMYLSASHGAVGAVLMTERDTVQTPVYFISRALQGPELNYTPMEKLVLALVFAAKRLQRYFQAHPIAVITNQPIKQIISRPDVAGRLQKWSVMVGEHNITYQPRTSVKGQILTDFLMEKPEDAPADTSVKKTPKEVSTLFMDGSSCTDGSGARLILISPEGTEFTYALRFQFTASNDEAEYKALVAGLRIASQMGVRHIQENVDSKLVANQVLGVYVAKEENMVKYLEKTNSLVSGFDSFSISHVSGSKHKKVDALSKIASTSFAHLSRQVLVEILNEKSINGKEVAAVVEEEEPTWMTPIVEYLRDETLPEDSKDASKLRFKARQYEFLQGPIRGAALRGSQGHVFRILLANHAPRCAGDDTQVQGLPDIQIVPVPREPQQPLTPITDPWPFYKWGIDIAGPFPEGPGKVKFLIVSMDYFTKWIEAKVVATISGTQVKKFVWNDIVCRFGLHREIISDNGKQFSGDPFKDWCEKLNIVQRFTSVKHPQSKGLVEWANRSLGEGIKARLGENNKNWLEELPHVLWAHRTMIKSSNDDTSFSLTYRTEAVIPAEIGMPTYRTTAVDVVHNDDELRLNLDLVEERHERAAIREAQEKLKMKRYYGARVKNVAFGAGDFVYRSNDASHAIEGGKLGPKWEGLYEVLDALGDGAYKLRSSDGMALPRTWNITNLKKCYI